MEHSEIPVISVFRESEYLPVKTARLLNFLSANHLPPLEISERERGFYDNSLERLFSSIESSVNHAWKMKAMENTGFGHGF